MSSEKTNRTNSQRENLSSRATAPGSGVARESGKVPVREMQSPIGEARSVEARDGADGSRVRSGPADSGGYESLGQTLNRFRRSLAVRMSLWFALVFVFSATALFASMYLYLSHALEEREQSFLLSKVERYVSWYEHGGLRGLREVVRADSDALATASLFVRMIDQRNQPVFTRVPDEWVEFRRVQVPLRGGWGQVERDVGIVRIPRDAQRDFVLVSAALKDGAQIQVGRSTDNRRVLLEPLRRAFLRTGTIIVLVGFIGGAVFAHRATRPIRQVVETARDIIATGRLEARVPHPGGDDELSELVGLFNSMIEKNQGLIRAMRESLDNAAHDLRTPLTRLRMTADLALQDVSDAVRSREALADCVEESERVLSILNTLMDVTEAEAGMMRLRREEVSVDKLLADVIDVYEFVAEDRDIRVSVQGDPSAIVEGDADRLRQVFANLLDNALKYTEPGGKVQLTAIRNEVGVEVRIKDSGAGIAAEEQGKIWARLYRGDKSRSQRGLGLGLSLVKAVVEAHGGSVGVRSKMGEGSEFFVQLPGASRTKAEISDPSHRISPMAIGE